MKLTIALLVAALTAVPPRSVQEPGTAEPPPPLRTWIASVERHQPGRDDEALRAMLGLPTAALEATFDEMVFVLEAALGAGSRAEFDPLFKRYARARFARGEREAMMAAAARLAASGLDRFLKRAALLHADLGILAPDAHQTRGAGTSQRVKDGRDSGDDGRSWHWMLGRAFLHLVPNAGGDRDVRLWYQAVGSHLWSEGNYAELRPLVRRGLEIFPADAEILFLLGAMHEAQGAPHIQAAADSLRALSQRSPGRLYQLQIGSPQRERGDAEEAYREALRTTPSHAEARLRLGRVLSLNGRHTEAAARLREAIEGTTEAKLRYLGHLFLARVEEWRGRTAAAATQYDAATRLFPRALSPRLALSQIALQAGNRGDARQILALLAEGPGGDDDDPWWAYHRDRVPASDTWLARLRASVAEAVQ